MPKASHKKPAKNQKSIYLDYAATTPVDPQVVKAMMPYFSERFGNPSSMYSKGREAKTAITESRTFLSHILNCKPEEIYFTAGGTESINIAVLGIVRRALTLRKQKPHIIVSAIEHSAVLSTAEALEKEGVEVSRIKPDAHGFVSVKDIQSQIQDNTVLISVMYANNEVGSVQPVSEIAKLLKKVNQERVGTKAALTQQKSSSVGQKTSIQQRPVIVFHTDACQASGSLDLNVQNLGVDLMSLNGSKIYGPKQIGLLYAKNGLTLSPILFGGGQESALRSGTENVPSIVGFAKAFELILKNQKKETQRLIKLRNYFISEVQKKISGVELNGPDPKDNNKDDNDSSLKRLPNNINFSFLGVEGEALMLYLDSYGICVSTGSACDSASVDPSHVIQALGKPADVAASSIRFTLGKNTSKADLDYTIKILIQLVAQLRQVTQA